MVGRIETSRRGLARSLGAFSLVELLVVIAIIAMLIAILLPSLKGARQAAKRTTCLTRLKGIASSSHVYENEDPYGWGIPVHAKFYRLQLDGAQYVGIGAYEFGGKSGVGRPNFVLAGSDPLNSKYGTRAGFGPTTRPLNGIIYSEGFIEGHNNSDQALLDTKLELEEFRCPSDDGPPRGGHCPDWVENSEQSSYDHFGTSFSANIFMTWARWGPRSPMRHRDTPIYSNSPYLRPLARVPTPTRTIFYEENIGRWAWAVKDDPCPTIAGIDPGPTKAIRGWHGKDWTYSRSFCDGHSEFQKVVESEPDDQGFMAHYRVEELGEYPPPDPEQAADDDWKEQYRCITVRGDGWQKDTLPSPRIRTHIKGHFGPVRVEWEDCVAE